MRKVNLLILAITVFMLIFGEYDCYADNDDITILFNNSPSYIMDKEDAGFRVSVYSTGTGTEYLINYTVDDTEYTDTVSTSAYRREYKDIKLADMKKGIHKLNVSVVKDGEAVKSLSADICVIDYYEKLFMDEYSRTYMSTHFLFDNQTDFTDLGIMKKIGVAGVRDEIYWETVEWKKGIFDFQRPDGFMPKLREEGMDTCIIFDYSNHNYVTTSVNGEAATNRTAPRTAEEMKAFVNYVKRLLEQYPQITSVEIWNEPNWGFWEPEPNAIDYAAMVKAVSNAVREINPDICIMAGSLVFGGEESDFLREMLDEGIYAYVDAISTHPYTHPNGTDRLLERRLDSINDIINEYGGFKGHIATETGATTANSSAGCSEDKQASEIVKTYVYDDSRNIDSTYWYTFRDTGDNPYENEDRFGILHRDYTAKPALAVLSQYTNRLNGAVYCGRLNINNGVKAFLYMAEGVPVVVAWTTGESAEITLDNNGVQDMYGNSAEMGDTVKLTTEPVYIWVSDEDIYKQSAEYELGEIYNALSDKLGLSRFEACDNAEDAKKCFSAILERGLMLIDDVYNNHSFSERKMMSTLDTLYSAAEKYALLSGIYGGTADLDYTNTTFEDAKNAVYAQTGVKQYSSAVLRRAKICTERMNEISDMEDNPAKNTAVTYYGMCGRFLSELSEHIAGYEKTGNNRDVLLYTSKTNLELEDKCDLTVTAENGGKNPIKNALIEIKNEKGEKAAAVKVDINSESSATADITIPYCNFMLRGENKLYVCLVGEDGDEIARRGININVTSSGRASDLYQKYSFEDASAFIAGENFSCSDGAVQFMTDNSDYPAYAGKGAVYFNLYPGNLGFSFWDSSETAPAAGDGSTLGGYFMFKLMQPLYDAAEAEAAGKAWFKLPQMVFKKGGSEGETLAYFNPDNFSVADIEPYTWYRIPLTSTGVTFTSSDIVYCNITNTSGSGIRFMLDDIILTCINGDSEPTSTPTLPPTSTPASMPTPMLTPTPTLTPTQRPTSTPTLTPTLTPAQTPTPSPSQKPAVEISVPHFYKDGEETDYAAEGDIECRITIRNNTSDKCEIPSAMILCVYDDSDRLVGLAIGSGDRSLAGGGMSELIADITMPDMSKGGFYAKILLWNDIESMIPAAAAWEINKN